MVGELWPFLASRLIAWTWIKSPIVISFLFLQGQEIPVTQPTLPTCQPITVPLCRNLPYTETILPNTLGHQTQEDANLEIQQFVPLIQAECSPHLKPFLCSVYTPKCVLRRAQPPCRTNCEQARSGCEPLMRQFGFQWPESLKCEAFTTESCEQVTALTLNRTCCKTYTLPEIFCDKIFLTFIFYRINFSWSQIQMFSTSNWLFCTRFAGVSYPKM